MKFIKANLGFVIVACIIVVGLVYSYVVEHNVMAQAPVINKVLASLFTIIAGIYIYLWSKDSALFQNEKDDSRYFFKNLAIVLFFLVAALLTIGVFHSGPLGLSDNPIK